MPEPDSQATHTLERAVHWTLLSGLLLSAGLLVAGLLFALARPASPPPERSATVSAALRPSAGNHPSATLLGLGLLVLMATPVLRVVTLAVGWTIAGEARFALVALVVLALLGVSLTMGFR